MDDVPLGGECEAPAREQEQHDTLPMDMWPYDADVASAAMMDTSDPTPAIKTEPLVKKEEGPVVKDEDVVKEEEPVVKEEAPVKKEVKNEPADDLSAVDRRIKELQLLVCVCMQLPH